MIRAILHHLTAIIAPSSKVYGVEGIYLTRYTLLDLGKKLIRIKIHRFHRSDEDPELHSHPWKWALSLVLAGGYAEERCIGEDLYGVTTRTKIYHPGGFNLLWHDTFHRVELMEHDAWTLFITGPVVDTWFFMDPWTGRQTFWEDFIRNKGLEPDDE